VIVVAGDQIKIVVGVDGSDASKQALQWAARYAETVGGRLVVLTARRPSVTYGYVPDYADEDLAKAAQETLHCVLNEVLGGNPTVSVESNVAEGHAADVLTRASADADLQVVGSRGHGAFAGMLLGSTSQHCAHQATCPVVIVRYTATA
jgi:nucleotide-binding universal stress UspA family protein